MRSVTLPESDQRQQSEVSQLPRIASRPIAPHLSMRVSCADSQLGPSFIARQYVTYPFRLSRNLFLDPTDTNRVYAYIMNAGPGILEGDNLRLELQLGAGAALYLTDQSATKVHSRSAGGDESQLTWTVNVADRAYLEYAPEPIILFATSALTQRMQVTLHPQGRLILGEIIVPGRLARGEFYAFDRFQSRLLVQNHEGHICFVDNLRLLGESNALKRSHFLTKLPIMGNFVVVVPGVSLVDLAQRLSSYAAPMDALRLGHSPLPGCHGLLVRAMSNQVSILKAYQRFLLNCVRQLTGQPSLPDIPK